MAANNKCDDCGKDREPNYKNSGTCAACKSERNKAKRIANRLAKGRSLFGAGRSPNCSKCGAPKEETMMNSGYCRKCKAASEVERRAKNREARGLPPLGKSWGLYCYDCKALKENPKKVYCNACRSKIERERYAKNYANPEYRALRKAEIEERKKKDDFYRLQKFVGKITSSAIRNGTLKPEPCEVCGTTDEIDAHHDDYMQPLQVRWLCRAHHKQHHANEEKKEQKLCQ